eukprot:gene6742-9471_t
MEFSVLLESQLLQLNSCHSWTFAHLTDELPWLTLSFDGELNLSGANESHTNLTDETGVSLSQNNLYLAANEDGFTCNDYTSQDGFFPGTNDDLNILDTRENIVAHPAIIKDLQRPLNKLVLNLHETRILQPNHLPDNMEVCIGRIYSNRSTRTLRLPVVPNGRVNVSGGNGPYSKLLIHEAFEGRIIISQWGKFMGINNQDQVVVYPKICDDCYFTIVHCQGNDWVQLRSGLRLLCVETDSLVLSVSDHEHPGTLF